MMYDVVIIGSGPAGYTPAIYTSRAFLKTLILSGREPGGQLTTTTEVDNFPGFPNGVLGPQLVTDMKTQVERFGTEIQASVVSKVTKSPDGKTFVLTTESGNILTKTVIIATG